MNGPIDMKNKK